MIDANLVNICSSFLTSKNNDLLKEVLRLLGSLVSLDCGRAYLKKRTF